MWWRLATGIASTFLLRWGSWIFWWGPLFNKEVFLLFLLFFLVLTLLLLIVWSELCLHLESILELVEYLLKVLSIDEWCRVLVQLFLFLKYFYQSLAQLWLRWLPLPRGKRSNGICNLGLVIAHAEDGLLGSTLSNLVRRGYDLMHVLEDPDWSSHTGEDLASIWILA